MTGRARTEPQRGLFDSICIALQLERLQGILSQWNKIRLIPLAVRYCSAEANCDRTVMELWSNCDRTQITFSRIVWWFLWSSLADRHLLSAASKRSPLSPPIGHFDHFDQNLIDKVCLSQNKRTINFEFVKTFQWKLRRSLDLRQKLLESLHIKVINNFFHNKLFDTRLFTLVESFELEVPTWNLNLVYSKVWSLSSRTKLSKQTDF